MKFATLPRPTGAKPKTAPPIPPRSTENRRIKELETRLISTQGQLTTALTRLDTVSKLLTEAPMTLKSQNDCDTVEK